MMILDAVIIGAGPSGIATAIKLMQLGHSVIVISTAKPKVHLQLETVPNLNVLIDAFSVGCLQGRSIVDPARTGVSWWLNKEKISRPVAIVDRFELDEYIHSYAKTLGLTIYIIEKNSISISFDSRWNLTIPGKNIKANFVIDATGRNSQYCVRHNIVPWKQIAIRTLIKSSKNTPGLWTESIKDGWIWAIKDSKNRLSISLFADYSLSTWESDKVWDIMLKHSRLKKFIKEVPSCFIKYEVTPSATSNVFNNGFIFLGDAAFTRDPLGSQGLLAGVSNGQSTAIAIHTIQTNSSKKNIAINFLENKHIQSVFDHKAFIIESYKEVLFKSKFWLERKVTNNSSPYSPSSYIEIDSPIKKSSRWELRECPTINNDTIELATCLCSNTDAVRWLAEKPVQEFLAPLKVINTPRNLLVAWRKRRIVSDVMGIKVLKWLIEKQVLVPCSCSTP